MAIVMAIGDQTRLYRITKNSTGKKCYYSFLKTIDVSADQFGDYGAVVSIINELMDNSVLDCKYEEFYCVLTAGSGVMYKTISIPLNSLDTDLIEAKTEDEKQQALTQLKDKYMPSGFDKHSYDVMLLERSSFGSNVYITLAFVPAKLISSIIELCNNNNLDLLGIAPEIQLLKKIIAGDECKYFISQASSCTIVNDLGMIVLNGQYPIELAKEFLVSEANRLFDTNYLPGPVVSEANIGQYMAIEIAPADNHYSDGCEHPLEIAAAIAKVFEDNLDNLDKQVGSNNYSNNANSSYEDDEGQVNTDGFFRKIKRLFTKK